MPVTAKLIFSQGVSTGTAGQAFFATIGGGAVGSANQNNTGVATFTYTLTDVAIGSALVPGILSSGATPTASFTPDVAGAYRVELTVEGFDGTTATVDSTVIVKTARGWVLPAFKNNAAELNYPNPTNPNTVGWKDSLNNIFGDISSKGFFVDQSLGAADTNVLAWNAGTGRWAPSGSSGGVTWANDLAGSTNTTQTVVALHSASPIPVTTALTFGTNPASTGVLRLANAAQIVARNAANSADVIMASVLGSNLVRFGDANQGTIVQASAAGGFALSIGGTTQLSAAFNPGDFLALGSNPATAGFIRVANNATVSAARNAANTGNIPLLGTDASNNVNLGDSAAAQGALTVINGTTGLSLKSAGTQVGSLALASGDFLKLGPPTATGSAFASTGLIRFGDVTGGGSSVNLIAGRNNGNSADVAIISVNGAGTTAFGDYPNFSQLNGLFVTLSASSGTYQVRLDNAAKLKTTAVTIVDANSVGSVPFVFDSSDNSVTSWDFKINAASLASITASKFTTKKGLNRAVRRTATSTTLTTSDDILVFSATGQTATLPSSPSVGDIYVVSLDIAGTGNTYATTGPANSIVFDGTSFTTLTVTTTSTSPNAMTFCWTGSFWVAAHGF